MARDVKISMRTIIHYEGHRNGWAQMALASLVAILGPKKVSISGLKRNIGVITYLDPDPIPNFTNVGKSDFFKLSKQ
jgi:hypothetical protein